MDKIVNKPDGYSQMRYLDKFEKRDRDVFVYDYSIGHNEFSIVINLKTNDITMQSTKLVKVDGELVKEYKEYKDDVSGCIFLYLYDKLGKDTKMDYQLKYEGIVFDREVFSIQNKRGVYFTEIKDQGDRQ